LQSLTDEIDACVRDMLRGRRDEAFARSVQEGTQVSQAIAQSRCAGALARDFSAVLPPELTLRVLESVDVADVRRVMQVNTRCRDLARTALGSSERLKDCWRTGRLSAQRTFDGPGFVTGC